MTTENQPAETCFVCGISGRHFRQMHGKSVCYVCHRQLQRLAEARRGKQASGRESAKDGGNANAR